MPTIVSRNTIKLPATASAVNDYYKGYTLELRRYNTVTGKQLVQTKRIITYNGAQRVATIDGIWDEDFIPSIGDTYKIVPTYPDSRVSINTAIQTLDYVTSTRYGRGLDPYKDLYLPSWLEAARVCDTQSDVTVRVISDVASLVVGAVYRFTRTNGKIIWQGKVSKINSPHVTFTEVIGKLSNKWNSWKNFGEGDLIYDEDRLYKATVAGVKTVKPVHTSGTVSGLEFLSAVAITKFSGIGPATIDLIAAGNPVRSVNARGDTISGYSLYDSDGIDYWRYVGWDEHSQRNATRHQTNLIIDTSSTLFENTNSLLEHFGGIMRYTAGKYHLEVEQGEGAIGLTNEPRNISNDNIMGKIRINDEGIRSSFNSLTIAYADPGNKFEAKNISFFNSDFLKIDRNVPKKGNMSIPGITNYYNARLLADKFLLQSRYGLTISFNMEPHGVLLLAGRVIQIQNAKYGWVNKKFRITNITHNTDTSVDIVAKEYDDSIYVISNISRPPATALAGESTTSTNIQPGELRATSVDGEDETVGGIELQWVNSPGIDSTVSTEIFSSVNAQLFITVTGVTSNTLLSTETAHQLSVGDKITSQEATGGFIFNKTYYVKTVPSPTSFTLSETPDGPALTIFGSPTVAGFKLLTANILATVEPPNTSYVHVIPGQGTDRVERYYWIRHKINRG